MASAEPSPDNPLHGSCREWPEGDEVAIRLGSLDGDPGSRPEFHVFVASRAPWDEIPDDGLPRLDEQHT